MNCLYFAEEASAMECDYEVLILSNGYDDRSLAMSKILNNKSARITEILILQYENGSLDKIHALFPPVFPRFLPLYGNTPNFTRICFLSSLPGSYRRN